MVKLKTPLFRPLAIPYFHDQNCLLFFTHSSQSNLPAVPRQARPDQTGALEQRREMEERVEEGGAGEECPGDAN